MKTGTHAIAERLVAAREAKGLSKTQAKEAMGLKSTYYQNEDGSRAFTCEMAVRYADFFGVSVDWLLTGRGRGPGRDSLSTLLSRVEKLDGEERDLVERLVSSALALEGHPLLKNLVETAETFATRGRS